MKKKTQPVALTPVEYTGLQTAYDHFNAALFDRGLPDVFITYQRRANSRGYFSPDRFSGRVEKFGRHELALNPDAFLGQTDKQICSVLVHEMAHVWQEHSGSGTPSRGYHDKQWAAKMKSIGLMPSSTGMPGGKETGQRMQHYIIDDGAFSHAYAKLATTGWKLNLQSAPRQAPKGKPTSKTKFTCATCGQNAWGKPDLKILCRPCGIPMLEKQNGETPVMSALPSYEINPPVDEPVKPKRGRPKGSKNKPMLNEVAFETSPTKINNLGLIIWRLLENNSDHAQGEWGDRQFLTESEKEWLQKVDRKKPKLGDYHEARQIEERVIERRKKKWRERHPVLQETTAG